MICGNVPSVILQTYCRLHKVCSMEVVRNHYFRILYFDYIEAILKAQKEYPSDKYTHLLVDTDA